MEHQPIHKHKVELKEVSLEFEETFKRITCPSCHNKVSADNININDKIAKCNSCDVVFPFQKEIENLISPQKIKQEVIRPEGIDLFDFRDELDITIQQPFTVIESLLMVFCPMFLIGAIPAFSEGNLHIIPFTILCLITLVSYLNFFFRHKNKIHINIDDKYLYIEWRPKKFMKDKKFEINQIDQIYTKTSKTSQSQHYVCMIVNGQEGQKHINLIEHIGSLSKARYLEQEIERKLGIVDRAIPEEKI